MKIVGLRKEIRDNLRQGDPATDVVYINDSVKLFEDEDDAYKYKDYLTGSTRYSKDYESFIADISAYPKNALNIDDLIREDAIARLTDEERRVLGL